MTKTDETFKVGDVVWIPIAVVDHDKSTRSQVPEAVRVAAVLDDRTVQVVHPFLGTFPTGNACPSDVACALKIAEANLRMAQSMYAAADARVARAQRELDEAKALVAT